MTFSGWLQIALFSLLVLALVKPVGIFLCDVMDGRTVLEKVFGPLERSCYKFCGIDPAEMGWTEYALSLLCFSLVGTIFTYLVLLYQGYLPLNPMGFGTASAPPFATAMTPDLAFNTAASFCSNTNWQNYAGESTLSYFSQMVALAYHNWVSAAVGLAACTALIRGFARQNSATVGNFWKDLVRATIYVFLPMLTIYTLALISQGVIQNFAPYTVAHTLEGASQILPQGPVASQEAAKMLGINGGGFFNANSAHPYENPTPLSNFLQMLSIFILPAGMTYMFGRMVKDTRQGWALCAAMFILFLAGTAICYYFEAQGNPLISAQGVDTSTGANGWAGTGAGTGAGSGTGPGPGTGPETGSASLGDLGGNMEGKEVRFGLANSALFAVVTTDASCGAVNAMHDSFTPMGGLITMLNIQLGELVFGGVGSGLYGMLVFALLTVFIAGLMVGRTPEYVGKKIEKKDVKMCMLFVLAGCFSILVFTAIGAVLELPVGSPLNAPGATFNNVNNGGPHGFSEILYCFSSCTGNNGSAFGGLTGNTPFYNLCGGLAMLIGRFIMMVPVLALAGCLAEKKYVPPSSGTFPTHGWLFVVLLISVIIIVGALTFFPALTLGPVVEHFLMHQGRLF